MIYVHSPELATLFYMNDSNELCGLIEYKNNMFDTNNWFIVEDTNEYIDGKSIKDMHNKVISILKGEL